LLPIIALLLIPSISSASMRTVKRVKRDKPVVLKKLNMDAERTTVLKGEVNEETVTPVVRDITEFDKINNKDIFLILNSPGGSVSDGISVIRAIESVKSRVICVVDVEAYSMAAIIGAHCSLLYMHKSASIMFHEAAFRIQGQETQVQSRVTFILKALEDMHKSTASALGVPFPEYRLKIMKEWWMVADEANKLGVSDGTLEELLYDYEPPPPNNDFNILPLPGRAPYRFEIFMER
jgi:ATP-dependent Clp protease, protease subunit